MIACEIPSAAARHHEVEHDQVRALGANGVQRVLAVTRSEHHKAGLLQVTAGEPNDLRVVIDDKNAMRHWD